MSTAGDRSRTADDPHYVGPWLSAETLNRLPQPRRQFDLNRDPYIARQLRDQDRSEAERRRAQETGTQSGGRTESDWAEAGKRPPRRNARMVAEDRPNPALHPANDTGRDVDRQSFHSRWLVEQRDAALAQARARQDHNNQLNRDQSRRRDGPEPSW